MFLYRLCVRMYGVLKRTVVYYTVVHTVVYYTVVHTVVYYTYCMGQEERRSRNNLDSNVKTKKYCYENTRTKSKQYCY